MKTIVTISNDYESGVSWDFWVDDISILKQESSIYAEKDHNLIELPGVNYVDDLEECHDELTDGADFEYVTSTGYSQGDKMEFLIVNPNSLIKEHMSQLYTHKNDYYVTAKLVNPDGWEKKVDLCCNSISITDIEFPELDDIIAAIGETDMLEGLENIEYVLK